MAESIIVNAYGIVGRSMRRRKPACALLLGLAAGIGLGSCGRDAETPPVAATEVGRAAVDASLEAAEQYLTAGNTASARAIIDRLLVKAPREPRAHELYGRILYLEGVRARGAGHDAAARRLVSESSDWYRSAVENAEADGGFAPSSLAGMHQSAGEIASAAERPEQALEHFRAAGRLDPASSKPPLYEAQILLQLSRSDEASRALQRTLQLDPDEAYAHASLAELALNRADSEAAVGHITKARRIDPGNLTLRLQEARIHRRTGEPGRGLELLVALDEPTRAQEAIAAEIAECYLRLGEPRKAAEAWELCYRLRPRHPGAWRAAVRAAEARITAGDRDRALWLYDQAKLYAPDQPEVRALGELFAADR